MSDPSSGRTSVIWRDGQLIPWDQATLHVMSHVVHYGSSVFEGIRCYETPSGPAVFRLREHMRRLVDSCRIYRIELPWTVDQLVQATVDTVAANELRHCYLRPVVVRAGEQMGVLPFGVPIETFIIAWKWGAYLGPDALANGVDVCVSSWRRAAPGTFPTMAKAGGNYLNSQLAKMEARTDGYVEAITLDSFGYISEGSGENLFVIRDGVIYTSALDSAILNGITRDSVIHIARDLGLEVRAGAPPARDALHRGRAVLHRHGGRADADPLGGPHRRRGGEARPAHQGDPGPLPRHRHRSTGRHVRLADARAGRRDGALTA
jgi:branched-chain amino acid aminotransferase